MVKRTSVAKKNTKIKAVQSGPALRVEYPREGEILTHPTYTFHIAAIPEVKSVEVSIDNGDWKPCRESVGLWWYDWANYRKGKHTLVVRTRIGNDMEITSEPRRFTVA